MLNGSISGVSRGMAKNIWKLLLHYSGFQFWRLQQLTDNGESSARENAALNGNWDEMRIQGLVAKQANYGRKKSCYL